MKRHVLIQPAGADGCRAEIDRVVVRCCVVTRLLKSIDRYSIEIGKIHAAGRLCYMARKCRSL